MRTVQLLPNPGRRSEDLSSLPPSTEGSCLNALPGRTYRGLAATNDVIKIPEGPAARPRSRDSLRLTLHPQPCGKLHSG